MRTRDPNLDLLRAGAILMVLFYHIVQRWPVPLPFLAMFAQYGGYGVDLFFVLSGWLIGGLLWRERDQFGNVEIGRFIGRRALRTVPPYLAALLVSYLGVWLARREPFDWSYLFFLQNYHLRIPFFLISWSLCIEEHFYLFTPFIVLMIVRVSNRAHWSLLLLAAIPMCCRAADNSLSDEQPFGYHITATHLRYEGLLLGVWASFLRINLPGAWIKFRRFASLALFPMLLGVFVTAALPAQWRQALLYTVIAMFFLLLLVALVERRPVCFSDSRAVFWIASTSYSIYLTHAFTLDVSLRLLTKLPSIAPIQSLVIVSCIGGAGLAFYYLVELPSLAFRHRVIPGRKGGRSMLLDPVPSDT